MAAIMAAARPSYRMVEGRHLTAVDRQLVDHVLAHRVTDAHTKRKAIQVTRREPGRMDFTITTKENDDYGRPAPRRSQYSIEIDE